jgi:hypothetical protein
MVNVPRPDFARGLHPVEVLQFEGLKFLDERENSGFVCAAVVAYRDARRYAASRAQTDSAGTD